MAYPPNTTPELSDDQQLTLKKILLALTGGAGGSTGIPVTPQPATGSPSLAITKITALTDGTATLAARATRRGVTIENLAASAEAIFYGPTTGVNATTGFRLEIGQSQSLDYKGALFFFGAAGTGTIQTVETYD